jgi:hypothetical protein
VGEHHLALIGDDAEDHDRGREYGSDDNGDLTLIKAHPPVISSVGFLILCESILIREKKSAGSGWKDVNLRD